MKPLGILNKLDHKIVMAPIGVRRFILKIDDDVKWYKWIDFHHDFSRKLTRLVWSFKEEKL